MDASSAPLKFVEKAAKGMLMERMAQFLSFVDGLEPCSWRRHSQCVQRQDQWQSTFRNFCQYRGARTSSVRSASASGRVHS